MTDLDTRALQLRLGVTPDGVFGPRSRDALFKALSNLSAPAMSRQDMVAAAARLGVRLEAIVAVRAIEAPRGAFDSEGRPTILYEKHVFGRSTGYRFNKTNPDLSSNSWQPGTYGPFSAQYEKLRRASALDLVGAFKACSWGAFQVLGENAVSLGYADAVTMALDLAESEAAHLDCFVRFVTWKRLDDELRECRPGDPDSCIPFVAGYNGSGFRANGYHVKFAGAMAA